MIIHYQMRLYRAQWKEHKNPCKSYQELVAIDPTIGLKLATNFSTIGSGNLFALREKYKILGKEEWWWIMDDSIEAISRLLLANDFVVIDGFLGMDKAAQIRSEISSLYEKGQFDVGELAGGRR